MVNLIIMIIIISSDGSNSNANQLSRNPTKLDAHPHLGRCSRNSRARGPHSRAGGASRRWLRKRGSASVNADELRTTKHKNMNLPPHSETTCKRTAYNQAHEPLYTLKLQLPQPTGDCYSQATVKQREKARAVR